MNHAYPLILDCQLGVKDPWGHPACILDRELRILIHIFLSSKDNYRCTDYSTNVPFFRDSNHFVSIIVNHTPELICDRYLGRKGGLRGRMHS